MKAWPILMVLALAVAGCTDGGDDEPSPTTSSTTTSSSTSTTTTTTQTSDPNETAANTPPTATLRASATTGAAPLNVTFDLNGSDADGDPLVWVLDADDDGTADYNGTELPATVNFTYQEGEWNATFAVTDGFDAAVANVTINATAGGGEPGGATVVHSGTVVAPDPSAADPSGAPACTNEFVFGMFGSVSYGPQEGVNWWRVGASEVGAAYQLEPADAGIEAEYWAFPGGTMFEAGTSGTIPLGATDVVVCGVEPTAANVAFTLTHVIP